jgi:DNA-binding NarL/FixJ family response regulator
VITVLLTDDQALVRAGFRALLDAQPDIEVVAEADDGAATVRLAVELRPDVVLMDIRMPGTDGLAATKQITADPRLAGVHVVILTIFELDEYVFEAVRTGASGFLVKDTEPADLISGVRAVAGGDALLSPGFTRRVIAEFARRAKQLSDTTALRALTDREREVMALVAQDLSNEDIAAKLFVSPATAKTHVSRAMVKLGARDRAQLVVIAYEASRVRVSASLPYARFRSVRRSIWTRPRNTASCPSHSRSDSSSAAMSRPAVTRIRACTEAPHSRWVSRIVMPVHRSAATLGNGSGPVRHRPVQRSLRVPRTAVDDQLVGSRAAPHHRRVKPARPHRPGPESLPAAGAAHRQNRLQHVDR